MRNTLMMTSILALMTGSAAVADTTINKTTRADVDMDGVSEVSRNVRVDKDVDADVRTDARSETTTYRAETYVDRSDADHGDAVGINRDAHVVADVDGNVGLGTPMTDDNSVEVQTKTRTTTTDVVQ
jgi:hypothetical protein